MREIALGHWHYFTWNLPAALLMLGGVALAVLMARSLHQNEYGHAAREFRWRVLGWAAIGAAVTSAIALPLMGSAANVTVDESGTWHVSNYLGVPLATVPPSEMRSLRGVDLGGAGLGLGHLEIRRSDGTVIRSVRLSRETLDGARRALGYTDAAVHDYYGDQVIAAHRYGIAGPVISPLFVTR